MAALSFTIALYNFVESYVLFKNMPQTSAVGTVVTRSFFAAAFGSFFAFIGVIGAVASIISAIWEYPKQPLALVSSKSAPILISGVPSVIDGNTLEISGNQVRLFGIDAPEGLQTCETGERSCIGWYTVKSE